MADTVDENESTRTTIGASPGAVAAPVLPVHIGEYRILGVLGRGGMGIVYEAEQQSPARLVALKVILGDASIDETKLTLFRREVEVLARLEHPMIARLYASGRTDEGRHWFAMELVRGRKLSAHLRERGATLDPAELRRRLTLVADIAEAVHYAHQRGVIHRDLKPSNILVVDETDATGHAGVKILDFGVARMTDGDVQATRVTEVGTIRGTLPYMSPEQARGRPDAIDARSDIYSLGVILYEMLAGRLPLELSTLSIADALRAIEEKEPPSVRQLYLGSGRLDEDVGTIVSKALAKDANVRYASAAGLAEDLRRYLDARPILARPPSAAYLARRFVRRNPLPTAFATAIFLLLIAFAGAMAWQARRIAVERDRAQAEADKAAAINKFLQETLETPNPFIGGERQVTVVEALDRSLDRVGKDFAAQPLVEAAVRMSIGTTYFSLAQYEKAETQLRRALDLDLEHLGPHHVDTAAVWGQLSRVYHGVGRYDEAIAAAKSGIEGTKFALGPKHWRVAERLNDLGLALFFSGRPDEAESYAREAVTIGRDWPEGPTPTYGESLILLADILHFQGKLDEAEPLATEAIEVSTKTLASDSPQTDRARNTLSLIALQKQDYDRAEKLLLENLGNSRRTLGDKHPQIAIMLENLGNVYFRSGHPEKTIEILDQVAALRRESLGPDDPAVGRTLANRGMVLWRMKRLAEADRSLGEGVALMRRGLGADHPDLAQVLANWSGLLEDRGKGAEAEKALRESLRIRRAALGETHRLTAATRIDLGLNLLSRKVSVPEARALLHEGVKVLAKEAGEDDPRVRDARAALAR